MPTAERKLYVGAPVRCQGWEVYYDVAHDDVDYTGSVKRLHDVHTGVFSLVYVTTLDRLSLRTEAMTAMHDWLAALRPGGMLMLTVPDQAAIGRLLADPVLPLERQVALLRMQATTSHWTAEVIALYLQSVGFRNVCRAERFGLFNDLSELAVGDTRLALNVMATRP